MSYAKYITEMSLSAVNRSIEAQRQALDTKISLDSLSTAYQEYFNLNELLEAIQDPECQIDSILCWDLSMLKQDRAQLYDLLSSCVIRRITIVNGDMTFDQNNSVDFNTLCSSETRSLS